MSYSLAINHDVCQVRPPEVWPSRACQKGGIIDLGQSSMMHIVVDARAAGDERCFTSGSSSGEAALAGPIPSGW